MDFSTNEKQGWQEVYELNRQVGKMQEEWELENDQRRFLSTGKPGSCLGPPPVGDRESKFAQPLMEKFARREWRFEICVLKSHPLSLTLMGFPFTNKPPVGMSKMLSSQLRDHIFWVTKAFKQSALAEGSLTTNVCTNRKPCINVHILPVGSGWYASIAMKRNYPSGS